MEWKEEPYPPKKDGKEVAGHLFPFSQMGTVKFNDGTTGAVAWLPKPFCLVVDVPDRQMLYRLELPPLLEQLDGEDLKVDDEEEEPKPLWMQGMEALEAKDEEEVE